MGIITLVLWPLALVWAYLKSGKPMGGGSAAEAERKDLIGRLYEARQRLAALESRLPQQRAAAGG